MAPRRRGGVEGQASQTGGLLDCVFALENRPRWCPLIAPDRLWQRSSFWGGCQRAGDGFFRFRVDPPGGPIRENSEAGRFPGKGGGPRSVLHPGRRRCSAHHGGLRAAAALVVWCWLGGPGRPCRGQRRSPGGRSSNARRICEAGGFELVPAERKGPGSKSAVEGLRRLLPGDHRNGAGGGKLAGRATLDARCQLHRRGIRARSTGAQAFHRNRPSRPRWCAAARACLDAGRRRSRRPG